MTSKQAFDGHLRILNGSDMKEFVTVKNLQEGYGSFHNVRSSLDKAKNRACASSSHFLDPDHKIIKKTL